jgi:hypothetical protein
VSMDSHYLMKALGRWNYFPNQRADGGEIPPIFSSRQMTPAVIEALVTKELRKGGYDQVDYYATRYNNVVRPLSIPHPTAYAHLASCLCENWQNLSYICENKISLIKPEEHPDGRALVMDYESPLDKTVRALESGFGKLFRVHTDITNCFPSVYSHAIPWATVGFAHAKKHKGKQHEDLWFNRVDYLVRMTKRNETQGVAIGPGTSNVVTEAILARIDERLSKKYSFCRYIDDYVCYCEKYDEAQRFIQDLNDELRSFRLSLNLKKTEIVELPAAIDPEWIVELSTRMPAGTPCDGDSKFFSAQEAIRFIEFALTLKKSAPDGSVLKYAVKSVIFRLQETAVRPVLEFLLLLASHYPLLLPLLRPLLNRADIDAAKYAKHLNFILIENAVNRRSDGMCWALFLLIESDLMVSSEGVNRIIESRDSLAITLVHSIKVFEGEVKAFADTVDPEELYDVDRYWLLFYQRYVDGVGNNPYKSDDFDVLKEFEVSFMPAEGVHSGSEQKLMFDELGFEDESAINGAFVVAGQ